MLGVINEHINFEGLFCTSFHVLVVFLCYDSDLVSLTVTPGQPTAISDDTEAISLVGTSQDLTREINEKDLHWGVGLTNILVPVLFSTFDHCFFVFTYFCTSCLKIQWKKGWRRPYLIQIKLKLMLTRRGMLKILLRYVVVMFSLKNIYYVEILP
jgi:hypothetical protein